MQENKLPKWMDLLPEERHRLIGEIIDAMVYNEYAVLVLQKVVEDFRLLGWIKSTILPNNNEDIINPNLN
jgi:hypothetical protein